MKKKIVIAITILFTLLIILGVTSNKYFKSLANQTLNKSDNTITLTTKDLNKLKKNAQVLYYDYHYKRTKYVNIVWKWVLKDMDINPNLPEKQIDKERGFSKRDIYPMLVDINNDKRLDILTIPGRGFCGHDGCTLYVFIAPDYKPYDFDGTYFTPNNPQYPIYILKDSTNGFKDIILGNRFFCKFKRYKYQRYTCYKIKEKKVNDR